MPKQSIHLPMPRTGPGRYQEIHSRCVSEFNMKLLNAKYRLWEPVEKMHGTLDNNA